MQKLNANYHHLFRLKMENFSLQFEPSITSTRCTMRSIRAMEVFTMGWTEVHGWFKVLLAHLIQSVTCKRWFSVQCCSNLGPAQMFWYSTKDGGDKGNGSWSTHHSFWFTRCGKQSIFGWCNRMNEAYSSFMIPACIAFIQVEAWLYHICALWRWSFDKRLSLRMIR